MTREWPPFSYVVWWDWPVGVQHGRECNGGSSGWPQSQEDRFLRFCELCDVFGIPWRANVPVTRDLFGRYVVRWPF